MQAGILRDLEGFRALLFFEVPHTVDPGTRQGIGGTNLPSSPKPACNLQLALMHSPQFHIHSSASLESTICLPSCSTSMSKSKRKSCFLPTMSLFLFQPNNKNNAPCLTSHHNGDHRDLTPGSETEHRVKIWLSHEHGSWETDRMVVPVTDSKPQIGASLVAQWLRICLLMQGTRVRALLWEDPTCRGATRPVSHNY